jgi:hypothetical protein
VFGGFVAALISIPCAAALQVITKEIWRNTALFPGRAFGYRPSQYGESHRRFGRRLITW